MVGAVSTAASKAQILSNRELFIQSGSDINLTCIAPQAPGPYTHMMWYKDSELINDSTRGGIRVVSEQQMKTSNLVISRVLHRDTGNYTCAADNSSKYHPQLFSQLPADCSTQTWTGVCVIALSAALGIFISKRRLCRAGVGTIWIAFHTISIAVTHWFVWLPLADSDSVLVHIIKSEQHAAMQHELATRMQTPRLMLVLMAFFYVS